MRYFPRVSIGRSCLPPRGSISIYVLRAISLTVAVFTDYIHYSDILRKLDSVLGAEPTPEHHRMDQVL